MELHSWNNIHYNSILYFFYLISPFNNSILFFLVFFQIDPSIVFFF